jgi:hypothetical protein
VSWQRPFRHQAWPATFDVMVDLTFDEHSLELWRGPADAFAVLVDREDIETRLRADLKRWEPPPLEVEAIDSSAWPWLAYLDSNCRNGRRWAVRAELHSFLNDRVIPVLTRRSDSTERDLSAHDLQDLHEAAPASGNAEELRRSIRATAMLYVRALEQWKSRTGTQVARHPMADMLLDRFGP